MYSKTRYTRNEQFIGGYIMKRIAFILLSVVLIIGVGGCKKEDESPKKVDKKVEDKKMIKKQYHL